ncbi:uncharacterized protein Dwil_GK24534 [Drosophila willistoni]|uniref:Uncharacterized protein n=1 Tax=Drosophila willistoni TaxID=7260 RepID=B4N095_DROWI|nr:uncharacterized protein LOC6643924 [Drosophila willistoni]EDW77508.1 uncharacterized protein Dwil_GK24534 [Drosophila willistoni]
MNRDPDPEVRVYGMPQDENISHALRVYALAVLFALVAQVQRIIVGVFIEREGLQRMPKDLYGWWLICTFIGISTLAWTATGRKFPINMILIATIVEGSSIYILMDQKHTPGILPNFYITVIVVALVVGSCFWGAYFPMRLVPGDLLLSLLVAVANIMIIAFFVNSYFIHNKSFYTVVRNYFALVAISMVMYTATIIHDRQFDVPKNEYLFLSVLLFFAYMILHERILALSLQHYDLDCDIII